MISFFFSLRQWVRFLFTGLYLVVIVMLSLMPGQYVPELYFNGMDKVIHGGMYLLLTLLACWTFHAERKTSRIFLIMVVAILTGILTEIVQFRMHLGRSFEWLDILSNATGTTFGILLFIWINGKNKHQIK